MWQLRVPAPSLGGLWAAALQKQGENKGRGCCAWGLKEARLCSCSPPTGGSPLREPTAGELPHPPVQALPGSSQMFTLSLQRQPNQGTKMLSLLIGNFHPDQRNGISGHNKQGTLFRSSEWLCLSTVGQSLAKGSWPSEEVAGERRPFGRTQGLLRPPSSLPLRIPASREPPHSPCDTDGQSIPPAAALVTPFGPQTDPAGQPQGALKNRLATHLPGEGQSMWSPGLTNDLKAHHPPIQPIHPSTEQRNNTVTRDQVGQVDP